MGFLIDTCIWIDVERGYVSPSDVALFTKSEPVQNGLKLLTRNEKDFIDIPGLDLVIFSGE